MFIRSWPAATPTCQQPAARADLYLAVKMTANNDNKLTETKRKRRRRRTGDNCQTIKSRWLVFVMRGTGGSVCRIARRASRSAQRSLMPLLSQKRQTTETAWYYYLFGTRSASYDSVLALACRCSAVSIRIAQGASRTRRHCEQREQCS